MLCFNWIIFHSNVIDAFFIKHRDECKYTKTKEKFQTFKYQKSMQKYLFKIFVKFLKLYVIHEKKWRRTVLFDISLCAYLTRKVKVRLKVT